MRRWFMAAAVALVAAVPVGRAATIASIPQAGGGADELRGILRTITLPPGFHIALYAMAPGARALAVDPQGGTVFVGSREDHVYAVTDHAHAGVADSVTDFAPAAGFRDPNGVCFTPDGALIVAERNRVRAFPDAAGATALADPPARTIVPEGRLVPPAEEAEIHGARVCRVGPDGKLYIALGQPYNVPPKSKQALYDRIGMGGIVRMNLDGGDREVFAHGIRNSVGLDFNPHDGVLWFTDNQVDEMGDDIPPGELNRAVRAGLNFGFPWYGGGHIRTIPYRNQTPPPGVVFPEIEMVAHAADLGMTFYRGHAFPAKYQGAIFSAQHGSWNRTVPIGARVMVTYLKPDGTGDRTEPFAEGWLDHASGQYRGRPVDMAELPDGSLLVSDDYDGALYRITYTAR